jgi:predicted transposase YbfD/YdcC
VPAPSSSPIPAAAHAAAPAPLAPDQCGSLLDDLALIADPRHRRGRRHPLVGVLGIAVCAVLAGARSLAAIGEWAADAPGPVLAALGGRRDPWTGALKPPGAATVRRVLARVDPDALDRAIGAWLACQQPPPPATPRRPPRAVAVDGKTLRDSGHHPNPPADLLAAMNHTTGGILAQTQVHHTTNEIARFRPLLDHPDLAATVITADALHTQREHADWLVAHKHAAYLLIVKRNPPALHQQPTALPWRQVPIADHTYNRGHGRVEIHKLQVTTVAGLDFPHATQALRITRRVRTLASRCWRTVTVYAITSLTAVQASPARLADYVRGHWGIEALHHLRDVAFARTPPGSAPAPRPAPWPACAPTPRRRRPVAARPAGVVRHPLGIVRPRPSPPRRRRRILARCAVPGRQTSARTRRTWEDRDV